MIGDSTMADKPDIAGNPERGWGMVFPSFFNDNVVVENHARNGRSTKTFIAEGRWNFALGRMGKGDYVFIQFGHNDEVETKKSYTPQDQYEANLRRMVRDVLDKGAHPILCTSVARRKFDSVGNPVDTHPVYPEIMKKVAKDMNVPLIDMKAKSTEVLKKYGIEGSKHLYMNVEPGKWKSLPAGRQDDTHFQDAGAMEMAKLAVEGIEELNIKPLKKNLLNPEQVRIKYTTPVEGIDKVRPKQ